MPFVAHARSPPPGRRLRWHDGRGEPRHSEGGQVDLMEPIGLDQLATIVGGSISGPARVTAPIRRVTVHSGQAQAGSVFFALTGRRTDGALHAEQALAAGAAAAVVARDRAHLIHGERGPVILVDNPLAALHRLAGWWRSRLTATVVAVVGSHGKTVTKDALVHFASASRQAYGSPGSYNSQLGVALALLGCPVDAELAVIEAAASEPGEMARLAAIVRPDHVVVTYVGSRYAARFGGTGGYARELLAMAAGLGPAGWVLFGRDDRDEPDGHGDPACDRQPGRRLVHGVSPGLPRLSPPGHTADSLQVRITFPDGGLKDLTVVTTSADVLTDVGLAVTAAWLLAPDSAPLVATGPEYSPTSTTVETWQTSGGVTVVRDVASVDPIRVGTALRTSRRLRAAKGRAYVVLADPLTVCEPDQADALGTIIGAGGVDGLWGLDTPAHAAVAAATRAADPSVPVRLFATNAALRAHLVRELRDGDVALVEAPAGRSIVDLSGDLIESMPPTRLYLDATVIGNNVMTFRRLVGPSVRLMGVVKALAYGTNAAQVAACLQDAGVDFLGVASVDEGVALRRAGVDLPVLVLLGTSREVEKMLRHGLVPLVYSPPMLDVVLAEARAAADRGDGPVPIHLEVDSGMHRTGFQPEAARDVLRRLADTPAVRLDGVMTHLSCADIPADDDFTREQLRRYHTVVDYAYELGFTRFLRHAAATAATIRFPEAHLDMVRIGVGLYGVQPSPATAAVVDLVPAVSLVSRVVETYDLQEGERVGYGGTFVAPAGGSRIGVVPAGYHDCVPRAFSNFGRVTVGGETRPIIGVVSMDSMTIDLTDTPSAQLGSDVLIYGRREGVTVSLEEVSAAIGTIAYELLVRVGPRVQRIVTRH
jgi:Alr-MurF fusion protein